MRIVSKQYIKKEQSMSFRMDLWKITDDKPQSLTKMKLDREELLEEWIEKAPSILDYEILILGRQVHTDFRGRIDMLGIDRQGDLIVLELKRDKSARDVVAQVLDYASWVRKLSYNELNEITYSYLGQDLAIAFAQYFDEQIPDPINVNHRMIIAASELDDTTERIIQYLADEHDVDINVVFFSFFASGNDNYLGRAWMMPPDETDSTRSEKSPPWEHIWFINVGEKGEKGNEKRVWEDNVQYGYMSAGGGSSFSNQIKRPKVGDKIFAYLSRHGYVGYGIVKREAVMIRDFIVEEEAKPLLDLPLKSNAGENKDDPELCDWAIAVDWKKIYSREKALSFPGIFVFPSVVCKLRHPETINFLKREFGLEENGNAGYR